MPDTVFTLQSSDSPTNWLHARALCSGGAHAVASLHRGLDLSAGADITAGASAQVADTVKAALGANADVELSLAAAFPLNFFSQAGVIADVEAAIAATGSLDLEVDLPIATLIDRVTADAGTGAWADLAKIVCQQLQVSAGYWAMVGLEVQARAQALLVGSFLPQADGSTPGFTFHCEYGMGTGSERGRGWSPTSGSSTRRRSSTSSRAGRRRSSISNLRPWWAVSAVRRRPTPRRPSRSSNGRADRGSRGLWLGPRSSPAQTRAAAERSVARSAVSQLQSWLMARFVDLATSKFGAVLSQVENAISQLPSTALSEVINCLQGIIDGFSALGASDSTGVDDWLWAIQDVCEPLWLLLRTPLIDSDQADEWQDDVALLWAAGSLANAVAAFVESDGQAFDPTALAPTRAPGDPIAAHVATTINKPTGSGLTFADLITFLVANDRTTECRGGDPRDQAGNRCDPHGALGGQRIAAPAGADA